MSYEIILSRRSDKFLDRLNKRDYIRITKSINELQENPHPIGTKKLKGVKGLYRLRIGNYRAIYEVKHRKIQIHVLDIAHRKDIYKK